MNSWRCAFALHQKRFLIPKHSSLLLPAGRKKWIEKTFHCLPSSLSSQLFHINLKTNDLSLCLLSYSPFAFILEHIWYLNDTKIPRMVKNTQGCGAASDKILSLLSSLVQSPLHHICNKRKLALGVEMPQLCPKGAAVGRGSHAHWDGDFYLMVMRLL